MARITKLGKPTTKTVGAVGDIYVDRLSGLIYKCTLAYRVGNSDREYIWRETNEVETFEPEEEVEVEDITDIPVETSESEEEVEVKPVQKKRNNYRNNYRNNNR